MAKTRTIERFDAFVRRHGFKRIDSWVRSAESSLPENLDEYVIVRPLSLDEAEQQTERHGNGNGNGNGNGRNGQANGNGRGVSKHSPN